MDQKTLTQIGMQDSPVAGGKMREKCDQPGIGMMLVWTQFYPPFALSVSFYYNKKLHENYFRQHFYWYGPKDVYRLNEFVRISIPGIFSIF